MHRVQVLTEHDPKELAQGEVYSRRVRVIVIYTKMQIVDSIMSSLPVGRRVSKPPVPDTSRSGFVEQHFGISRKDIRTAGHAPADTSRREV